MGKASGVSRRRRKKYNYNRNLKKLHKKQITLPKVKCKQIKEAWDSSKSYVRNMEDMGLSDDPNKTIGIRENGIVHSSHDLWVHEEMEVVCVKSRFLRP
ncbi:Nucleolar protein 16 like protein [Argiope bruennichi]|uniref:Nucleolar protein 16 n=1 Tax=Argiope bruennichi TaxID=94029 RepID=A0A8T0FQN8_ARGBR|nr:Nucleolar protein 16 like protein [Argiope bruennichi]